MDIFFHYFHCHFRFTWYGPKSPALILRDLRTIGYKAPKLPKNRLGALMAAFHGGWSEAMIRGNVPVILLDFKKMYQKVWVLMEMRRFLERENIKFTDCTARIKKLLDGLTLGDAFAPSAQTHSESTGTRSSLARMAFADWVQTNGFG
jgi:hypothetical protein